MVGDPTTFVLSTARRTRFVRVMIRNDGSQGYTGYAELRSQVPLGIADRQVSGYTVELFYP